MAVGELFFFGITLPLEYRLTDQLLRISADRSLPDRGILVVDIDEKSLAKLAEFVGRWPWPRSIHAELIEAALEIKQPEVCKLLV